MTDSHTTLPAGWSEVPPREQRELLLLEYQYQTDSRTTFLVSTRSTVSEATLFKLRLSTITSDAPVTRHDYPIAQYETREKARENAIEFTHHLTTHLENGTLSPDVPETETIQTVITEFSSEGLFPRFRTLSRRLL